MGKQKLILCHRCSKLPQIPGFDYFKCCAKGWLPELNYLRGQIADLESEYAIATGEKTRKALHSQIQELKVVLEFEESFIKAKPKIHR